MTDQITSYWDDFVVERHGEKDFKVNVFLVHVMWIWRG